MSRMVIWLQTSEQRVFHWVNRRVRNAWLDAIFQSITHLGGASATIVLTLCIAFFGNGVWSRLGWASFVALAASHLPVALIKRTYPRLRPYLVWPDTRIGKNPLKDHSFPSGHTTAVFSVVTPFVLEAPFLGALLLPLAGLVGISRMYLGLHYPSDVLAGAIIGSAAGAAAYGWMV